MGAPLSICQAAITALLQGLQHAAVAGRVVSGGVCREVWPRVRGKRQLTGCHCDAHQAAAMVCSHAVLMITRVPGAGCNAWPLPQMHASQGYGTFWLCRLACAQHVNGSAMVQVCCEWPGGGWRWCSYWCCGFGWARVWCTPEDPNAGQGRTLVAASRQGGKGSV